MSGSQHFPGLELSDENFGPTTIFTEVLVLPELLCLEQSLEDFPAGLDPAEDVVPRPHALEELNVGVHGVAVVRHIGLGEGFFSIYQFDVIFFTIMILSVLGEEYPSVK